MSAKPDLRVRQRVGAAVLALIECIEWRFQLVRERLFPTCPHWSTCHGERAFFCNDCGAYRSRKVRYQ